MFNSELKLTFSRLRTKILILALSAVPIALAVVLKLFGSPQAGRGPNFIDQVTNNGVFAALAGIGVVIPFLLPLCVSVIAGDTVAGEASFGTLRYVLTQPVSRLYLLIIKFLSGVIFSIIAAVSIAIAGLIIGVILFPIGPVTTLSGTTIGLESGAIHILAASLVVGLSMSGLVAIGVFISTVTENPSAAMAGTVAIAITSQVLDALPQVSSIHPFLFTHFWSAWGDLLRFPVTFSGIESDLGIQIIYIAIFLSAAWAKFSYSDITS